MNAFLIGGVIVVAILVIWLALKSLQGRQKSGAIESQMNELRRDLQTIATSQASSTGQLETIAKSVAQRLDGVTPTLQRSEEHTSELQSQSNLVCRLLLEKKKIVRSSPLSWCARPQRIVVTKALASM